MDVAASVSESARCTFPAPISVIASSVLPHAPTSTFNSRHRHHLQLYSSGGDEADKPFLPRLTLELLSTLKAT